MTPLFTLLAEIHFAVFKCFNCPGKNPYLYLALPRTAFYIVTATHRYLFAKLVCQMASLGGTSDPECDYQNTLHFHINGPPLDAYEK
jgi:hypothetical protein